MIRIVTMLIVLLRSGIRFRPFIPRNETDQTSRSGVTALVTVAPIYVAYGYNPLGGAHWGFDW